MPLRRATGWTTYLGVAVMTALLALYLVFAARYGFVLIGVGEPVAIGIGVALLVFPVLGLGVTVAELAFTIRAQRLATRLESEGGMPDDEVPIMPSGRVDRAAAAEIFPRYQRETEEAPDDWRSWFRLGLAYDANGDRRRARWAIRQAIRLS
ncbi:MAG TPA: hypothetical protein VNT53_01890 [Pseudolysinimonas sp.]|nr:hypothetical protein [Pseudolysinimonas sp.]